MLGFRTKSASTNVAVAQQQQQQRQKRPFLRRSTSNVDDSDKPAAKHHDKWSFMKRSQSERNVLKPSSSGSSKQNLATSPESTASKRNHSLSPKVVSNVTETIPAAAAPASKSSIQPPRTLSRSKSPFLLSSKGRRRHNSATDATPPPPPTLSPKQSQRNTRSSSSPRPTKSSMLRAQQKKQSSKHPDDPSTTSSTNNNSTNNSTNNPKRTMLQRGLSVPNIQSRQERPSLQPRQLSSRSLKSIRNRKNGPPPRNLSAPKMQNASWNKRQFQDASGWHSSILHHDWEHLEYMLKNYDRRQYTCTVPSNAVAANSRASTTGTTTRPTARPTARPTTRSSTTGSIASSTNRPASKSPIRTGSSSNLSLSPHRNKRKPIRKLKIMKFLSKKTVDNTTNTNDDSTSSKLNDDDMDMDELPTAQMQLTPLLRVDGSGRTPLHLACQQSGIPIKLLQKLLFVERSAASVPANNNCYPLHSAILNSSVSRFCLDRLVYAYPQALSAQDSNQNTPMYHAIQRALVQANGNPTNDDDDDAWEIVNFLCDASSSRHKFLSSPCEKDLLKRAIVKGKAPSYTVEKLTELASRFLINSSDHVKTVLEPLLLQDYPVSNIVAVLELAEQNDSSIFELMKSSIPSHFNKGTAKKFDTRLSFCGELLKFEKDKATNIPSKPCQDWWYKLRFIIGYCTTPRTEINIIQKAMDMDANYILHKSLLIPNVPASLIEFMARLFPNSPRQEDPESGLLPIDIASKQSARNTGSIEESSKIRSMLEMLADGDKNLARMKRSRLPTRQSAVSERTSFHGFSKTVAIKDPITQFYPFQTAALPLSESTSSEGNGIDEGLSQLSSVYELLRSDPSVFRRMERKKRDWSDLEKFVGPIASALLDQCYTYETTRSSSSSNNGSSSHRWSVNSSQVKRIHDSIKKGRIPPTMSVWWDNIKSCIWQRYEHNAVLSHINLPTQLPQKDPYVLHAAVLDSDVHPMIIDLLIATRPMSAAMPYPNTDMYPLHVACMVESYCPLPFEQAVVHNRTPIECIAEAYPDVVEDSSRLVQGRMPIHLAAANGKTLSELCVLLQFHPSSLSRVDPCTKMLPFALVAMKSSWASVTSMVQVHGRMLRTPIEDMSASRYCKFLETIRRGQDIGTLTTVFLLIRSQPAALTKAAEVRPPFIMSPNEMQQHEISMADDMFGSDDESKRENDDGISSLGDSCGY